MSNDVISEKAGCINLTRIGSLIWPTVLETHKRRFQVAIDRIRLAVDWTFDLMLLLWLKVAWWSWLWLLLSILILIYKMNIAFGTSESKWMDGLEFLIHMHFLPIFLFGFIDMLIFNLTVLVLVFFCLSNPLLFLRLWLLKSVGFTILDSCNQWPMAGCDDLQITCDGFVTPDHNISTKYAYQSIREYFWNRLH